MVLSSRICGYSGGDEIDFSIIFEYLHAATLLHDDVIDGADMRRGKQAAHSKWPASLVILTGDFLLARSLSIASSAKIPELINIVAKITEEMSQGEIDQLAKKGNIHLTEQEYMDVIRRKTAVMIQGACRSGAAFAHGHKENSFCTDMAESMNKNRHRRNNNIPGDGSFTEFKKKENVLENYGYHLGMAFQMADDLLDYTSDFKTMGKNPGADLREGKLTLPLIKALANAENNDRLWMEKIIKKPLVHNNDFQNLTAMLYKYKGIEYTESRAQYHAEKAKSCIDIFNSSKSKKVMMMLADYAVERKV
jgi:octaprenyl-diphosphate synthase